MAEQSQYAAASHVPLIKSPSLRIPQPVHAPEDIHPLPDDVNAYFVYPFTLEHHVLTLESSRKSTLASHNARHEAYLRQRDEEKERRKREALRRIAPGFEPSSAPLVPDRIETGGGAHPNAQATGAAAVVVAPGHARQRSVMDDMVDQLAAMDAASSRSGSI